MTRGRWLLLIAVVVFLASLCGVLAARHVLVAERPSETEVHKLLHEQLKLSPEQHSKIEALEKQQIKNTSDLQLTLPNVTFTKTNFTSSSFTIRGIGDLCVGVTCDSAAMSSRVIR